MLGKTPPRGGERASAEGHPAVQQLPNPGAKSTHGEQEKLWPELRELPRESTPLHPVNWVPDLRRQHWLAAASVCWLSKEKPSLAAGTAGCWHGPFPLLLRQAGEALGWTCVLDSAPWYHPDL